jgi:hypothetical protein
MLRSLKIENNKEEDIEMKKNIAIMLFVVVFVFITYETMVLVSSINVKRYSYPVNHNFYEISTSPLKALNVLGLLRIETHLDVHYVCDYEKGYAYKIPSRTRFYVKYDSLGGQRRSKAVASSDYREVEK